MKPTPKIYKGIEYIQLSDVPDQERQILENSFHRSQFIKILIDNKVVDRCILYKDYLRWVEQYIPAQGERATVSVTEPGIKLPAIK